MGIFIRLNFDPRGVKKSAWRKAYSESLKLLNAYEFCNIVNDTETFSDCKWIYARRAGECKLYDGQTGWRVCGDLPTLNNAESFFLHKDLDYYRKGYKKAAKSSADIYSQFACENYYNAKTNHIKLRATRIFHEKTQGYPYHLYILAIALLIENRFPRKAAVFGDVTLGQMRKAIEWANTVLTDKLELPDRCYDKKLLNRIKPDFPDECTCLNAFFILSLNDYSKELGTLLKNKFSNKGIKSYFKEGLKSNRPGTLGYNDKLRQFLKLGLDLDMLCEICVIDDDGLRMSPADFMRYFIELEFHVKEDELHQEMHALAWQHHRFAEDTEPQTIPSAITGSLMRMSGLNPEPKPFVSLEVIKEVFMRRFSDQCDVLTLQTRVGPGVFKIVNSKN
jgi:hypothetical protein